MIRRMSTAITVTVEAMIVAIIGIVIQIVAGVDYPAVPPGPILLAVAVLLAVFVRRLWEQLVAPAVALFLLVGGLISPTGRHNLTDPGNAGQFIGTAAQLAGVVVALVAGLLVLRDRSTATAPMEQWRWPVWRARRHRYPPGTGCDRSSGAATSSEPC